MRTIVFDRVTKCYRLGAGTGSLRDTLGSLFRRDRGDAGHRQEFRALSDVSFAVDAGETVGLLGSNGAGKTTSLKLISRVSWPTTGQVRVRGRVAALIELGAGFHPELSGRDNVYLNGAILGMSRAELDRKYGQITAFAELERFMDMPVKRYSSGMYARLAFAVAAHVEPDILLVDEVLAVGDINFQRKCIGFIRDYTRSGRTTLFVSHNMYVLEQLCDRVVWLDEGRLRKEGRPAEILREYLDREDARLRQVSREQESGDLILEDVRVVTHSGDEAEVIEPGSDVRIRVQYHAKVRIAQPHFALSIWDASSEQPLMIASMLVDDEAPPYLEGRGVLWCEFQTPPLMPRTYHVWGDVYAEDRRTIISRWQHLASFTVRDDNDTPLGGSLRHTRQGPPIRATYTWRY